MAWTVILRNNSGSTVEIVDLGIELQNTEVRTLSDTFSNTQLLGSADLKLLVTAGTLVVNNGVDDLTSVQGTNYVFPENIYHTGKTYALQGDFSDHGSLTGRNNPSQHEIASITGLTVALTDVEYTTNKGTSGGYATLDGSGLILYEELPQIAITSTYVVASSAEQVALDAQEGDVAVRTDENKSYIHDGGIAGDMTDWQELLTPTDTVLSVNGYVGAVTLAASDIGSTAGNVQTDVNALSAAISPSQDHTVLLDSGGTVVANASTGNLELESTSHIRLYGDTNSGVSLYVDDSNGLGIGTAGIYSVGVGGNPNMKLDRQANGSTMLMVDTGSTSSDTINASHNTTAKTGNFLEARMANTSGTFFGNFLDFWNSTNNVFTVGPNGEITSTTVDELSAAIVHNYTEHVSLSGSIDGNTTDIISLSGAIDTNITNISNNTTDVDALSGAIDGLTGNDVLQYWTEAYNTTYDISSFTPNSVDTNVDVALVPKGTGAITAQVATGTTAGGAKRGTYAVDFQMSRTAVGDVASGVYSFLGGGHDNESTGDSSVVVGGHSNHSLDAYATVGGGQANEARGAHSTVAGGFFNINSGEYATVAGGYASIANGDYSVIVGGRNAETNVYGQQAFASGTFAGAGEAQSSKYVLRQETIDVTPRILTTNGSIGGSAVNQIAVKDGQAISFLGTVTAKQDTSTNLASWKVEGVIVREGTVTTLVAHTKTVISNVPGWGLTISADDTNEALQFTFTGAVTTDIHIVAAIDTSEVIF